MKAKKIAITLPQILDCDAEIEAMLAAVDHGFIIHLRKPDATTRQLETLLDKLSNRTPMSRFSIHYQPQLAERYGLGGVHVGADMMGENFADRMKSRSCHSWDEVLESHKCYDYVFLSPIFDSISKQGYRSRFDLVELAVKLEQSRGARPQVVALGGIGADNLVLLEEAGFDGYAVLGALWSLDDQGKVDIEKTYRNIELFK